MTLAAPSPARPVVTSLTDAVAQNVRPGDSVLVMMGHSRWTAAARELARQFWRTDPEFTLIMTSLGALGAAYFRGGLLKKVITAYSGNSFPTYTPNPIFRQAYESGEVEVGALVDPHPLPAPGGGGPRPARHGDRLPRRLVHGRQRGLRRGRLAVRSARPARAAGPRRGAGARGGGRPVRQPGAERAAARRGVGGLGGPPGRGGHGRAGGRGRRRARAPGEDPGPPGPGRGGGALWRPSGRLLRTGTARAQLWRGHRPLECGGRGVPSG